MEIEDFIPTKGSKLKDVKKSYQFTIYNSHKKSTELQNKTQNLSSVQQETLFHSDKFHNNNNMDNQEVDQKRKQELEMKKYRYEIIKFGMSGFQKQEAQDAKVALAINLGAKPPKNKKLNYKKLIEIKKREQLQEIKKKKMQKFSSGFSLNQLSKKNKKDKKPNFQHKKSESSILQTYGKVTKDTKKYKKGIVKGKRKNK